MAKRQIKKKKKKGPSVFRRAWSLLVDESYASLRKMVVIVIPVGLLVAGSVIGMSRLEGYVKNVAAGQNIPITITFKGEKPLWVTDELLKKVNQSCSVKSDAKLLDDDLAQNIWESLSANSWISEVKSVHKCYGGEIQVEYSLREPLAVMVSEDETRYIDAKGTVMSFAPVNKHLVRIVGSHHPVPRPGVTVSHEDILAALDILGKIQEVDNDPKVREAILLWKPSAGTKVSETDSKVSETILPEIACIDVSNYGGFQDKNKPHITLYTNKNTEIRWGAAISQEIGWHEANVATKLTRLYRDYRDYGTLDFRSTGIELRDPVR